MQTINYEAQSYLENGKLEEADSAVIVFFEKLGYELCNAQGNVFREFDGKDFYYLQTDSQNHLKDCSTILLNDARRIYRALGANEAFGVWCSAGKHLLKLQDCKGCKPKDGRSKSKRYTPNPLEATSNE